MYISKKINEQTACNKKFKHGERKDFLRVSPKAKKKFFQNNNYNYNYNDNYHNFSKRQKGTKQNKTKAKNKITDKKNNKHNCRRKKI